MKTIEFRDFRHFTVRVKITSEFKVRAWIAKQLLLIAAKIINASIEVVE